MALVDPPIAPVIDTARLRLRAHQLDDLDARLAMTGNPQVMRFFGGMTQDREENWARLLRYAGHWALLGHGLFAVEEKASGRFAGEIGLADFHRGLGPRFDGCPEAAWMLDCWAEGQGFATEGMRAAIGWHAARHGPQRLVCIIAPDNAPSLRLAAKLGFVPFGETNYHEHPVILHERLPSPISG